MVDSTWVELNERALAPAAVVVAVAVDVLAPQLGAVVAAAVVTVVPAAAVRLPLSDAEAVVVAVVLVVDEAQPVAAVQVGDFVAVQMKVVDTTVVVAVAAHGLVE